MKNLFNKDQYNMKYLRTKKVNVFLLSMAFSMISILTFGQKMDEDLLDLSLEELMEIDVYSATKANVAIQKAPSIVEVYTQKDFQNLGFYTLHDVLNNITGIQIQEYRADHQLVWVKGVQQRYNNKVLLLIDGIPMRDSYYGNFNVDEMIPLDIVDKIEVISGKSMMYGANSFSGTINITTKSKGKSVAVDYGSFNSVSARGEVDYKNFYVNAGYYRTDGFQPKYNSDGHKRDRSQHANDAYASVKFQNESFMITGGINSYNYPYKYRNSKKATNYKRRPIYGAAKYTLDLEDKGKLNAQIYYNDYFFTKDKLKYVDRESDEIKEHALEYMNTAIYGGDVDYTHKFKNITSIAGVSYQLDKATKMTEHITYDIDDGNVDIYEDNIIEPNISRSSIGLFLQEMWEINNSLLLTGGIRYDILSDFDNQFDYRLGLTGQFPSGIYGKLLYGTAYRAPSYREYLDGKSFNPFLKPESINTFEAQVGYLSKKVDVNLTFFNNDYTNYIQELEVDSIMQGDGSFREVDDEMAFNLEARNINGIELNASIKSIKNVFLKLGASYLFDATENTGYIDTVNIYPRFPEMGTTDIIFLSDFSMNMLASYRFLNKYTVGLNGFYFGDRKVPANYQEDVPDEVQNSDNAKGFFKLDVFATGNIVKNLDFRLKVCNVLNEEMYSPPYGGSDSYDFEWAGITFNVGLVYRFKN